MGQHDAQEIRSALTRSGMSSNDIALLAGAAGKKGSDAAVYMQANPALAQIQLTREQQYLLYLQTYEEQADEAERLYNSFIKTAGGKNWDDLEPLIRDTLVDLKYRGDFHDLSAGNSAAHPQLAADFRSAVNQNSLGGLCRVFDAYDADWRLDKSQGGVWDVPDVRHNERKTTLKSGGNTCPP